MSESECDIPHAVGYDFRSCETCKHWKPLDPSETAGRSRTTDFRECTRIKHDESSESDGNDPPMDSESVFDEPAVVVDGSGYFAALRTKADFCCCLWEQ